MGFFGDLWDRLPGATGVRVVDARIPYSENEHEVTLALPGYRQTDTFGCGFVAGLMVLHTFKPRASLSRFYERVAPNPDEGTPPSRVIRALGSYGISARPRYNLGFQQLRRAIDGGYPVITLLKTEDAGIQHWVVVYGYGLRPQRVFVAGNGLFFNAPLRWTAFQRESPRRGYGLVCSM